eukprot:Opistho-2@72612
MSKRALESLHCAAARGGDDAIETVLSLRKVKKTTEMTTALEQALRIAAENDHADLVRLLLYESGLTVEHDVRAPARTARAGKTAAEVAPVGGAAAKALASNIPLTRRLLECVDAGDAGGVRECLVGGADVSAFNSEGCAVLRVCRGSAPHAKRVLKVLLSHPDAQPNGAAPGVLAGDWSPLKHVVALGRKKCLKALLAHPLLDAHAHCIDNSGINHCDIPPEIVCKYLERHSLLAAARKGVCKPFQDLVNTESKARRIPFAVVDECLAHAAVEGHCDLALLLLLDLSAHPTAPVAAFGDRSALQLVSANSDIHLVLSRNYKTTAELDAAIMGRHFRTIADLLQDSHSGLDPAFSRDGVVAPIVRFVRQVTDARGSSAEASAALRAFLNHPRVDVNATDDSYTKSTPLWIAANAGVTWVAELLLDDPRTTTCSADRLVAAIKANAWTHATDCMRDSALDINKEINHSTPLQCVVGNAGNVSESRYSMGLHTIPDITPQVDLIRLILARPDLDIASEWWSSYEQSFYGMSIMQQATIYAYKCLTRDQRSTGLSSLSMSWIDIMRLFLNAPQPSTNHKLRAALRTNMYEEVVSLLADATVELPFRELINCISNAFYQIDRRDERLESVLRDLCARFIAHPRFVPICAESGQSFLNYAATQSRALIVVEALIAHPGVPSNDRLYAALMHWLFDEALNILRNSDVDVNFAVKDSIPFIVVFLQTDTHLVPELSCEVLRAFLAHPSLDASVGDQALRTAAKAGRHDFLSILLGDSRISKRICAVRWNWDEARVMDVYPGLDVDDNDVRETWRACVRKMMQRYDRTKGQTKSWQYFAPGQGKQYFCDVRNGVFMGALEECVREAVRCGNAPFLRHALSGSLVDGRPIDRHCKGPDGKSAVDIGIEMYDAKHFVRRVLDADNDFCVAFAQEVLSLYHPKDDVDTFNEDNKARLVGVLADPRVDLLAIVRCKVASETSSRAVEPPLREVWTTVGACILGTHSDSEHPTLRPSLGLLRTVLNGDIGFLKLKAFVPALTKRATTAWEVDRADIHPFLCLQTVLEHKSLLHNVLIAPHKKQTLIFKDMQRKGFIPATVGIHRR